MTVNTKFEAYKIKREIKRSGKEYGFSRYLRDTFGEPIAESTQIGTINALYYEITSFIVLQVKEASQVRSNETARGKQPALLCLWEDVKKLNLSIGDFVIINDKKFTVNGVQNIQEWNIVASISLQGIDDGAHISV